jgi:prepilin-type N-terminal cleavage/methylation domain-containing protein
MRKTKVQFENPCEYGGFTLVEIMVVVVILALAAWAAVPMFSGAAQMQVQSAANMLASDLEFAKSMAISRQEKYGLVFHTDTESYDVVHVDANNVANIIMHPVKIGFPYTIDYRSDSRLNKVDLNAASFDGTNTIYFDYLGSPYNGNSPAAPLNSGSVTLQGGGMTITVIVEPVTGYIRIQ